MQAHRRPEQTNLDDARTVHIEGLNGRPTDRSSSNNATGILAPAEMTLPHLAARIEQTHAMASLGISAIELGAFRVVAGRARLTQVVGRRFTVPGEGNNVIYLKRVGAQVLLRLAVLAKPVRSVGNQLSKLSRNIWRLRHERQLQPEVLDPAIARAISKVRCSN